MLSHLTYSFENTLSRSYERISVLAGSRSGKAPLWLVWILSILLLVSAGIAYRVPAHRLRLLGEDPIELPVALSEFPTEIGDWVGSDIGVHAATLDYMEDNFADDYLSRRYISSGQKGWADLYVVYCSSRPSGILGHRPRVCYPANGWQHKSTEAKQFITDGGRQIDCLLHRFFKPPPDYERMAVLSFYVVNGWVTANERDFAGPFSRRPNLARDPSRYVAQVQVSSTLQQSIETAIKEMTDLILEFLPEGQSGRESRQPAEAAGAGVTDGQ